jgi:hypothetical protein
MDRTVSQDTIGKEEPLDNADTDEPPLRSAHTSPLPAHRLPSFESDLYQCFRKQLPECEDVSLLELNSPCDKDLISLAMADIKTRASMGLSVDHDDDDDVISMAEFQNIKPFEFHEHLKSSRDVVRASHLPLERTSR